MYVVPPGNRENDFTKERDNFRTEFTVTGKSETQLANGKTVFRNEIRIANGTVIRGVTEIVEITQSEEGLSR